jgi:hypothetical protein
MTRVLVVLAAWAAVTFLVFPPLWRAWYRRWQP